MSATETKPSTPSRIDNTELLRNDEDDFPEIDKVKEEAQPTTTETTPTSNVQEVAPHIDATVTTTTTTIHAAHEQIENIDVLFPTLPKAPKLNNAKAILKTNPLHHPEVVSSPRGSPPRKKKFASANSSPKKQSSPTKAQQQLQAFVSPSFISDEEMQKRKQKRYKKYTRSQTFSDEKILNDLAFSTNMAQYRAKQRKSLKEDYELGREHSLAEIEVYKRQKLGEWRKKLQRSPFTIDLLAENERIEEVQNARHMAESKRKREEDRKLLALKKNLIVNALLDVPSAVDVHRNYKRLVSEDLKKMKAAEEVKRHEAKQAQQQKKLQDIENERKKRIELRALSEML